MVRDAKFGIWAHWGPQAVPMEGDWYARKNVSSKARPTTRSPRALRSSVHERLEGLIPLWKAEEVGTGKTDGALQKPARATS